MIQDIFPHKLDNRFRPDLSPDEASLLIHFDPQGRLLMDGNRFPKLRDLPWLPKESLTFLFTMDGRESFFLLRRTDLPAGRSFPESWQYMDLKALRRDPDFPRHLSFAACTAVHLWHWYRDNRFCGRCGAPTIPDARERALRCACGNLIYPRLVPAVIVGVIHGDRLLVTKYRSGFSPFALVAGFTEIGETLEETVAREVMEETGLRVRNIRYYKSQPWGTVDDLLAGFYCDLDGDDTIRMDTSELKLAEWRSREEIELQPDDWSLTNEMMREFKEGRIFSQSRP